MKATVASGVGLAVSLLLAIAPTAQASTIFYTDRTAWEAALSGITTETFEGYPWTGIGGNSLGISVVLGGTSYSLTSGELFGVGPAVDYDAPYLVGNYLEWQNGSNVLTVGLSSPTFALGFDYGEFYGGLRSFSIGLGNGDGTVVPTNVGDYAFFGAISTASFDSLTIAAANYPLIDNLSVGTVGTPVPEPGSLALLGAGLGACFLVRRRHKA